MLDLFFDYSTNAYLLVLVVVVSTFMLEDLAIIGAGLLAASGRMAPELAFAATCLGMFIGDTALYCLGRGAHFWPRLARWCEHPMIGRQIRPLQAAPWHQIALIRCMPGLRTFGYIACGVAKVPLGTFTLANVISIKLWAALIFCVSYWLGQQYAEELTQWLWWLLPVAVVLFIWGQRRLRAKLEEEVPAESFNR